MAWIDAGDPTAVGALGFPVMGEGCGWSGIESLDWLGGGESWIQLRFIWATASEIQVIIEPSVSYTPVQSESFVWRSRAFFRCGSRCVRAQTAAGVDDSEHSRLRLEGIRCVLVLLMRVIFERCVFMSSALSWMHILGCEIIRSIRGCGISFFVGCLRFLIRCFSYSLCTMCLFVYVHVQVLWRSQM